MPPIFFNCSFTRRRHSSAYSRQRLTASLSYCSFGCSSFSRPETVCFTAIVSRWLNVAVPADERFILESTEALLDAPPQGEPVAIYKVETQCHQVVDVALHLFHIPDEEQDLEQFDVGRVQAGIGSGLVDRLLHDRVEEALDRWIEILQRNQNADFLQGSCLGGRLEGVEHRALATRQMQPGCAGLADGF